MQVHVDDIPHDELKEMIEKRCLIPPSRAERIVGVMCELHRRRQLSNVFAGRHAFYVFKYLYMCSHSCQPANVFAGRHAFYVFATYICVRKAAGSQTSLPAGTLYVFAYLCVRIPRELPALERLCLPHTLVA
jgi:hypothetical protein